MQVSLPRILGPCFGDSSGGRLGHCEGDESPAQIGEPADRVVQHVRNVEGDVMLFTSGHLTRVLTARWLALGPGTGGGYFLLNPASLSVLSYEHNLSRPVIRRWNDDHHVAASILKMFS